MKHLDFLNLDNTKNRRLLINEGQLMATLSPHVNILQLLAFLKDRQGAF